MNRALHFLAHLRRGLRNAQRPVLIVFSAIFLTVTFEATDFKRFEHWLYDQRVRLGISSNRKSNIVLITIDSKSTRDLNEFSPLSLKHHAALVEKLEQAKPQAIGYLVDFRSVVQNEPKQLFGSAPERLVSTAHRLELGGIPFLIGTLFDVHGEVLPPYPLSALPHSISVILKDGTGFADDQVTRRAWLHIYNRPAFHLDLIERMSRNQSLPDIQGAIAADGIDAEYVYFKYTREPDANAYETYSFSDVVNGKIPLAAFKNKLVLVGTMMGEDPRDFTVTPFSDSSQNLYPKIVVHAQILDSLASQNTVTKVEALVTEGIRFLLVGVMLWATLAYTPLFGVFMMLFLSAALWIVSLYVYSAHSLWIRESQSFIALFAGYYLAVPYRLIQEYKKRGDFQRKHDVLIQVEELKTNFLRLVTHDLKTPVARISGMVENLMRKTRESSFAYKKDLVSILSSTEELNHFISRILELTRLESNEMELKFESKDLNSIIEREILELRPLAERKNIQVTYDLETLFPIRLDARLISKVIRNLLDNAIKYSPENSKILIWTIDHGDTIEFKISDEGYGISKREQKNIFTKFYRVKSDQTSHISGTGLGLYLTRFFVEAHQGYVRFSSEEGKGTTFQIFLPTEIQESPGLTIRLPKDDESRNGGGAATSDTDSA